MTAPYVRFDPLLKPADADAMIRLCERYGTYGTYGSESSPEEAAALHFGEGLAQRHDVAINFLNTGGRFGSRDEKATLAARTNYFRETYAYEKPVIDGVEPFLYHQGFIEAAQSIYDRPLVTPAIVYANLLVPGQELAVHTDVPEFRGANRTRFPQWLMVVMHHSGLFESHRRPIATGIAYFHSCEGGALAFYPDGPDAPPATVPVAHNTAVLLDTDSVFHGVDRVGASSPVPPLRKGMKLTFEGDARWRLHDGGETLASYGWGELRYSVSWKAYCYENEADRRRAEQHEDDLSLGPIVDRLAFDLRERGRLSGERPNDTALALMMIDEYIHFPKPQPAEA